MMSLSFSLALQQWVSPWKRKRGHGHWWAWAGVEEMSGKPLQIPRVRFPHTAHLCCCEHTWWVPPLPESGRVGENL